MTSQHTGSVSAHTEHERLAHDIGHRLIAHRDKMAVDVDAVVAAIDALMDIQRELHAARKAHHHAAQPVEHTWKGEGAHEFERRARNREHKMTETAQICEQAEQTLREALASATGGRRHVDRLVEEYTKKATRVLAGAKRATASGHGAAQVHAVAKVHEMVPQHTKESAPILRNTHAQLTEATKVLRQLSHKMDNDGWNDPGSWWNDGDPKTTRETAHHQDHHKGHHNKHDDDGTKHRDGNGGHKHDGDHHDDGGHHDAPGPVHIGKRIQYKGVTVNERTRDMVEAVEKLSGRNLALMQGSYNAGNVAASAGTHDGGGAIDISVEGMDLDQRYALLKQVRSVGFAAWFRHPPLFPYHIHAIAIGDTDLSPSAADQVTAYKNGQDGLADHGPDETPQKYRTEFTTWEQYKASH